MSSINIKPKIKKKMIKKVKLKYKEVKRKLEVWAYVNLPTAVEYKNLIFCK